MARCDCVWVERELSTFHFTQAADYGEPARLFETLATARAEPSPEQIGGLVSRFAQVQGRSLEDLGRTSE